MIKQVKPEDIFITLFYESVKKEEQPSDWDPERPGRRASGCYFLDAVVDLIHRELRHARGCEYAARFGIKAVELNGAFRALTGMSFEKWLSGYLLLMCDDMMCNSKMDFLEIAKFLHFTTNTAFSQWYRLQRGMSPYEWKHGRKRCL